MLRLDALRLSQGSFRLEADCAFAEGAITALIGPSGAGKSTLLAAIAGFLAPVSGQVRWQGSDLTALPAGARPVTMLFQDHNLFPHMSVAANTGLALRPDLRLGEGQWKAVEAALERVGLGGFGPRLPGTLSGGQAGRAALARALLRNRPVLLLDEPFAALGPALRREMLDLVAGVQREHGLTVLMVTHLPGDAQRIAEFVSVVAEGRVLPPQPTARILADPPKVLRDYLG